MSVEFGAGGGGLEWYRHGWARDWTWPVRNRLMLKKIRVTVSQLLGVVGKYGDFRLLDQQERKRDICNIPTYLPTLVKIV